MAEHQPRMRSDDRNMIRNRARVAGPDADIDDGNAVMIVADQVIGGHLRQPRRSDALLLLLRIAQVLVARNHVAGFHERHIFASIRPCFFIVRA